MDGIEIKSVKKIGDGQIEVTKNIHVDGVVFQYDCNFLIQRKNEILNEISRFVETRRAEVVEIDAILEECEKLGMVNREELNNADKI